MMTVASYVSFITPHRNTLTYSRELEPSNSARNCISLSHVPLLLPSQERQFECRLDFATSSTEEECQRRVTAINALIALCKKQESHGFRRRRANIKVKEKQTSVSRPPSLSETLPVECKATQCIFCLGNEDTSAADRLKTFALRGDLKKHFHRKHLRHHPEGQPIACPHPRCTLMLNGAMHLQNHAEVVHKTRT